jgi:hypothetical protein
MIGLLLAALLLDQPAIESASAWLEFDRRPMGFGDSAFLYNRWSVRGDAGAPTAWITYDFHYSGRNPTTHVELWQVDCARRRSRVVRGFVLDGETAISHAPRRGFYRPIAPGSTQAALADRLCR